MSVSVKWGREGGTSAQSSEAGMSVSVKCGREGGTSAQSSEGGKSVSVTFLSSDSCT